MKLILLLALLMISNCYALTWEKIDGGVWGTSLQRTPVYKGWLIKYDGRSVTFVPDPDHRWKV